MSNTLVYVGAVIIFVLQLGLCFAAENRIIKNLPFAAAAFPGLIGVGYRLFYDVRHAWKSFVTAVYLYVALIWLAAALLARLVYKAIEKQSK